MPIYKYICPECGYRKELLVSFKDIGKELKCEYCEDVILKRTWHNIHISGRVEGGTFGGIRMGMKERNNEI